MKEKDEITLVELYVKLKGVMRHLWKRKLLIVLIGLLGGGLGLTYALLKPVEYSSKLSFIVERSGNNKLGGLSSLASSFGIGGVDADGGLYENQTNLMNYLKSRSIVETALLTKIPESKYTFAEVLSKSEGWEQDWKEDKKIPSVSFSAKKSLEDYKIHEDSLLFEMYTFMLEEDILSVNVPDEEGSITTIVVHHKNKLFARYLPEVLLDIVSKNYIDAKTRDARRNVKVLEHQVDSVKTELYDALSSSAGSTDQVFGLNPAYSAERVPVGKSQVKIQVASKVLEELIKNLELAKLRLMDTKPLIETIDRPSFPLEEIKKSKVFYTILGGLLGGVFAILFLLTQRFVKLIALEAKNVES